MTRRTLWKNSAKYAHLEKEEEEMKTNMYKEDKKHFLKNNAKCAHLETEEEQKMTRREKKPHCPLGLDHLDAGAEAQSGRTPRPLDLKFTQQNIKNFLQHLWNSWREAVISFWRGTFRPTPEENMHIGINTGNMYVELLLQLSST